MYSCIVVGRKLHAYCGDRSKIRNPFIGIRTDMLSGSSRQPGAAGEGGGDVSSAAAERRGERREKWPAAAGPRGLKVTFGGGEFALARNRLNVQDVTRNALAIMMGELTVSSIPLDALSDVSESSRDEIREACGPDVYQERFRVDRPKLEQMMQGESKNNIIGGHLFTPAWNGRD
jgi:hypothetical protein